MRKELIESLKSNQRHFGLDIPEDKIERLADYYELVETGNEFLHLVAPCSAAEFATRHILESLTLLEFLPVKARFADVGPGAGLPSIPCLIVRDDLRATLIESTVKKADFLGKTASEIGIDGRVMIVNRQFEEVPAQGFSIVTCRALDKFTQKLPRLLKWAQRRELLLFGGNGLRPELENAQVRFREKLMPLSERRYLFIATGGK